MAKKDVNAKEAVYALELASEDQEVDAAVSAGKAAKQAWKQAKKAGKAEEVKDAE